MHDRGRDIYNLCVELFPICRSITGDGVRRTLSILAGHIPGLRIHEVPTGTRCFDWTVPKEWNIADAYVVDPEGRKIIDFKQSNLHVAGYSVPVDKTVSLEELQEHLHSLPNRPDAIPYVTSYYNETWAFCLSHRQRLSLKPGDYRVVIQSRLSDGHLTYGGLILPGRMDQEVFLSTYVCHPSLANNEISGPAVTTFLAKWLRAMEERRYTYRIVFIPETIGAITYLSINLDAMKKHVVAGFNVTCVGDDRSYSYLPSRNGDTLADKAALHVLRHCHPEFRRHSFLERGSDERQYCSPGVDLPVVSVMRTKYGQYPEYHTSQDNLDMISPAGLAGGYEALRKCLECIEHNRIFQTTVLCEPQMGKRGLYPNRGTKQAATDVKTMLNVLAYADGKHDLLDIAETLGVPLWELLPVVRVLEREGLLAEVARETGRSQA
jgi:aminopeptidase-like protein